MGQEIFEESISVDPDKVAANMQALPPQTQKQYLGFLGQIRWHGQHLRFLAHLAIPINMVANAAKFEWIEECKQAFRRLKVQLSTAPIMVPPNWGQCFHVFVNASNCAIGNVLMREQTYSWFRPVYYSSRWLSSPERNYLVTERECLELIYSVKKFWHYLVGRNFYFHVDHSA